MSCGTRHLLARKVAIRAGWLREESMSRSAPDILQKATLLCRCLAAGREAEMAGMNRAFRRSVALKRERVTSFDEYPFAIPAVRSLTSLDFAPAVTFFIGENGSGKSALLEAIVVALGFNAEGGSKNLRFATRLSDYLRLARGAARAARLLSPRREFLQPRHRDRGAVAQDRDRPAFAARALARPSAAHAVAAIATVSAAPRQGSTSDSRG
ncbi:MAG: AAA family ATPase [Planctomycetota bacterium]